MSIYAHLIDGTSKGYYKPDDRHVQVSWDLSTAWSSWGPPLRISVYGDGFGDAQWFLDASEANALRDKLAEVLDGEPHSGQGQTP